MEKEEPHFPQAAHEMTLQQKQRPLPEVSQMLTSQKKKKKKVCSQPPTISAQAV